ncbi:MAG TPA: 3-oxoacyl-[acyl-carrier-protein] reductase [Candidatus Kapabacteria bacterium]|jgi:3-oxoacyl-[acyl-carrier protein] reductase|nr:3-oxoacyl-[acyl-carrier-protein] reductase [Candidatus Kapabacteria bacterium]
MINLTAKEIAGKFNVPMGGKKVAVVTGGSRGIGKAIVETLFHSGYHVVFTYNSNEEAAQAVTKDLLKQSVWGDKTPAPIQHVKLDVAITANAQSFIDWVIGEYEQIDLLVNNAGVTKDGLLIRMSPADWDLVLDTNLKGVYNMTKAAIRPMMSQKRGKIINITSVVALTGNPGQANYCAAKAGVIGFTKSIAKEVASRNITVNAVAPGYIETDMTAKLNDAQREAMLGMVPLKRAGTPLDVANVVAFLASHAADYITGQTIVVDGGMAM